MEEQVKKQKRKTYDKEFKRRAVLLVIEGGKRTSEVARDLGISENSLHLWKSQYKADAEHAFPGKGNLKPADDELRHVKKQLRDAIEERDILKKALAYFSRNER
jgi:transposase